MVMALDFDAMDPAPTTMFEARSYRDKAGGAVWTTWRLNCDLAQGDKAPDKKTRVGLPASPYDLKTYDIGQLHVCTEGAAAAAIGYMEVDYIVDLFTPQIQSGVGGAFSATTGLTAAALIGSNPTVDAQAVMPFVFTSASVITFNQIWEGVITVRVAGTGLAADYTPTVGGPAGGATALQGAGVVNAGTTAVTEVFSVRAVPGTTITPTMTATTVTGITYTLGAGPYLGY